ncbi:MAG: hypothetical protein ABIN95_05755 [Mucilaginibacter sp.]
MKKNKLPVTNYALPGSPMSMDEAKKMIKTAESGKFHSMQTVREMLNKWKAKYAK